MGQTNASHMCCPFCTPQSHTETNTKTLQRTTMLHHVGVIGSHKVDFCDVLSTKKKRDSSLANLEVSLSSSSSKNVTKERWTDPCLDASCLFPIIRMKSGGIRKPPPRGQKNLPLQVVVFGLCLQLLTTINMSLAYNVVVASRSRCRCRRRPRKVLAIRHGQSVRSTVAEK